jgi:hypothetical protein
VEIRHEDGNDEIRFRAQRIGDVAAGGRRSVASPCGDVRTDRAVANGSFRDGSLGDDGNRARSVPVSASSACDSPLSLVTSAFQRTPADLSPEDHRSAKT